MAKDGAARELGDVLRRFDDDLARLRDVMHANLGAEVRLVAEMEAKEYLTGGKRLRAIVALRAAKLCGVSQADGDAMATAIEFIHTATLLHDDVVDDAPMRRHLPAAARVYGNAAAVLAGDFLYSRASQMLARLQSLPLLSRIADATNQLAEGELLQLLNRGNLQVDEKTYFSIIRRKTANLFSAAAAAAPLLAGQDDAPLRDYGSRLGIAFQLVDDCLDYESDDATLGKKIGADFAEGKMTLPVIYLLARLDERERDALRRGWQDGAPEQFARTVALLRQTGVLEETRQLAQTHTAAAISALSAYPECVEKADLTELAQAAARRRV